MRILPIALGCFAVLLTAALIPMTYWIAAGNGRDGAPAGFGILFLCGVRAAVLIAAFAFLIYGGRLDGSALMRTGQALVVICGVVAMEVCACGMHLLSINEQVSPLFRVVYGVFATALPLCVVTGAFLASRMWFAIGAAGAFAAGLCGYLFHDALTAEWRMARMKQQQEIDEAAARRGAEFDRVPENSSVAALLPFVGPLEPSEVRRKALERIAANPDAVEQLSAMLDGEDRLDALYVLTTVLNRLPEGVRERCWAAAGSAAGGMAAGMERGDAPALTDVMKLDQSAMALAGTTGSLSERHRTELIKVRDAIRGAEDRGVKFEGTAWLDSLIGSTAADAPVR